MLSIAICDDEKNIRTYLSTLVKKQGTECEITEYASAEEYLSECRKSTIYKWHDLLFLDIEMAADGATDRNGMWLAGQSSMERLPDISKRSMKRCRSWSISM